MYGVIFVPDIPIWFKDDGASTPTIYGPFDDQANAQLWVVGTKSFKPYVIVKLEKEYAA